ncbi:rhodanese-like domain-containing protein [Carnobacterium gallinarum]|uniref:rhodanese-like domain-containing protein n=1 Tax=Carnobacterium gallinarum TaxID=2749 RepID=UPI000556100F|nr:rhodanese-like domain-containing protein [Carnobacterium gallinarum]
MYLSISTDELAQKLKTEQLTILDVREEPMFMAGHIPDAQHIPFSQLTDRIGELDVATDYYVICHSGVRSVQASDFLREKGFHVTNVTGGMSAWTGITAEE